MRVPELPHMRELPNPHKHWVFSQLPHFHFSSRPVPGHSSRARRFRAAGFSERRWLKSPRSGLGETSKSFVHLFKGGGVWCETPGPSGVARSPGARWAPFRTGLRCHFGRCWASATGRQHPRRQPRPEAPAFPYFKKEGTDVPLLGCHRARGFCLWKGQAQCLRARSRGYLLRSVRPVRCTFFSGCAG